MLDLDLATTGEASTALAMSPPVCGRSQSADEPEQCVGQVDPDGILHTLDATITLGVLLDVHLLATLAKHFTGRMARRGTTAHDAPKESTYITKEAEEGDP